MFCGNPSQGDLDSHTVDLDLALHKWMALAPQHIFNATKQDNHCHNHLGWQTMNGGLDIAPSRWVFLYYYYYIFLLTSRLHASSTPFHHPPSTMQAITSTSELLIRKPQPAPTSHYNLLVLFPASPSTTPATTSTNRLLQLVDAFFSLLPQPRWPPPAPMSHNDLLVLYFCLKCFSLDYSSHNRHQQVVMTCWHYFSKSLLPQPCTPPHRHINMCLPPPSPFSSPPPPNDLDTTMMTWQHMLEGGRWRRKNTGMGNRAINREWVSRCRCVLSPWCVFFYNFSYSTTNCYYF